jgi:hypothetical protein
VGRKAQAGLDEQSMIEKILPNPHLEFYTGPFDGLTCVVRRPWSEPVKPVPVRVEAPGTHQYVLPGALRVGAGPGKGGHLLVPGRSDGQKALRVTATEVVDDEPRTDAHPHPRAPRIEGVHAQIDSRLVGGAREFGLCGHGGRRQSQGRSTEKH